MDMNNWITQWFIAIIYLYVFSLSLFFGFVFFFLSKESAELNYSVDLPAMLQD